MTHNTLQGNLHKYDDPPVRSETQPLFRRYGSQPSKVTLLWVLRRHRDSLHDTPQVPSLSRFSTSLSVAIWPNWYVLVTSNLVVDSSPVRTRCAG